MDDETRERVEQAIEAIRESLRHLETRHKCDWPTDMRSHEALTTLSNALAESENELSTAKGQLQEAEERAADWKTKAWANNYTREASDRALTEVMAERDAAIERAEKAEAEVKVWWGCFPQGPNVTTDIIAAKLDELDAALKRAEKASQAENDAVAAFHLANQARDKWRADYDRLKGQLQEAEERWNSHSCTQKLQGLEKLVKRLNTASIQKDEEVEDGPQSNHHLKLHDELLSLRSTITQKDEQIEDVMAALARWVDNDPSVSPGENIRMMQDALARQLSESEKRADDESKQADYLNERVIRAENRLSESERERERLLDALERLGIYVNKYPSIPDLAAQVSKQLRQALSPDSQEKAHPTSS